MFDEQLLFFFMVTIVPEEKRRVKAVYALTESQKVSHWFDQCDLNSFERSDSPFSLSRGITVLVENRLAATICGRPCSSATKTTCGIPPRGRPALVTQTEGYSGALGRRVEELANLAGKAQGDTVSRL